MTHHATRLALAVLVAIAGCEYRDHATDLTLDKPCYELRASTPTTLYAQARGVDDRPIDGLVVSWLITPATLTITTDSSTTGPGSVGGLWTRGITSVTASVVPDAALPTAGLLLATAAVDGVVLTARSEIRLPDVEGGALCPAATELDAGVDADLDAPTLPVDAALPIDAP